MAMFLRTLSSSLHKTLAIPRAAAASLIPRAVAASLSQSRNFCQMMKETRNTRDHKRRQLAAKFELKRNLYKAMFRDSSLASDVREKALWKLSKLPRNSSFTRVRNRCIFSGRPRAVYQKFRMSRIVFRKLANEGQIMGVKKASW